MIFIFVLILNCFCIVFMVFNFLIYFTRFCDHLSQKINGHLLMLLSIVFGKEARLRHVVVWLFANYSWSYSAARGPNVWKVSFCSLFFAWTLLFTVCQQSEHSVEKCDCRVCFVFFFWQVCRSIWGTDSFVPGMCFNCCLLSAAGHSRHSSHVVHP